MFSTMLPLISGFTIQDTVGKMVRLLVDTGGTPGKGVIESLIFTGVS